MFLGLRTSSSCDLPAASHLELELYVEDLCKQTVIEISNQCNVHLFFSFFFFFPKKNELMAGILTVCKKKIICVGFGIELSHKNNNHAGMCTCDLVTIKKGCR